tara:strand:- start:247 stop:762 length:516 start_codon:yes stop_codon:yes gene_type:complete
MPQVVVTNTKGLYQESGNGVQIKSQVEKITNFYSNGYSAKTALFTAEAGYVYSAKHATGFAITLPTPTAGDRIKIIIGQAVTSGNMTIVSPSGYLLSGVIAIRDAADGSTGLTNVFAPDGTNDRTITLNGTTTGGLGGDVIELVGVADGSTAGWWVEGVLQGSGTLATMFS